MPVSLLMGSLSLQTIVNMWEHFHLFFKACTKDNEAMSIQQPAALTSYEHLGVRLCM